jgi:hypothetical protein
MEAMTMVMRKKKAVAIAYDEQNRPTTGAYAVRLADLHVPRSWPG